MTYVISDIHGEYDKYVEMLKLINFNDNDTLFVLGDVIDRGEKPIEILKDMCLRHNVYPLMGNHEVMALDILKTLMTEITEENCETQITEETIKKLLIWQTNGGDVTLKQFKKLPISERTELVEYIQEFEPYVFLDSPSGKTFVLVHGGFGNYSQDKLLSDFTLEELTFMSPEPDAILFGEDFEVIVGHLPTKMVCGEWKITKSGNVTYIDCGATFGGKLACLCLDTMKEFYI